jgi:hypothetical protein
MEERINIEFISKKEHALRVHDPRIYYLASKDVI